MEVKSDKNQLSGKSIGFMYKRLGLASNTITVSGIQSASLDPCSPFPLRHAARLHFPAFLAFRGGQVTAFWLLECEQK